MKFVSIFLFAICSSLLLSGQTHNPQLGARAAAMSNAAVTNVDEWAIHHNQAALAYLKKPTAAISYQNRFLLNELSTKAVAFALPTENAGTFGVSVSQFGYTQYNETKAGIAYARQLGKRISAGVRLNYYHIGFQESYYGNTGVLTAEIGMLAKVTDDLTIGAHLYNPSYAKIADYNDERIPVILRIGAGYEFSEKLTANVEVQKDLNNDPNVKIGAEYKVVDMLYLRGGLSTNHFENSFGFGLNFGDFSIDLASSYHYILGYSPQASMHYAF